MNGWILPVIITVSICASIAFSTWIRARHGYPLEDMMGNRITPASTPETERQIALLAQDNERLTGKIGRLEERIAVLERIATDPAERTRREIDALR
jgi:hypothetical protein